MQMQDRAGRRAERRSSRAYADMPLSASMNIRSPPASAADCVACAGRRSRRTRSPPSRRSGLEDDAARGAGVRLVDRQAMILAAMGQQRPGRRHSEAVRAVRARRLRPGFRTIPRRRAANPAALRAHQVDARCPPPRPASPLGLREEPYSVLRRRDLARPAAQTPWASAGMMYRSPSAGCGGGAEVERDSTVS